MRTLCRLPWTIYPPYRAVSRGARNSLVVGDMPFLSYHVSIPEAIRNAGRFIQEGGAQAVKLEGGEERVDTIKAILDAQIPVMGHIGLTPQSVHQFGGFKVQGKDLETAEQLLRDARALDEAGVFSIVLECVPAALARRVTARYRFPPLALERDLIVMGKCWSSMTCWVCTRDSYRNSLKFANYNCNC